MSEIMQLEKIRNELINMQAKNLDLLCGDADDTIEDTMLQKAFGFLLYEVDEKIREIKRREIAEACK